MSAYIVFPLTLNALLTFLIYEQSCQFPRQGLNLVSSMKPSVIINIKINGLPFQTTKMYDIKYYHMRLGAYCLVHWHSF